jgi:AcrR family transcriptional regulator
MSTVIEGSRSDAVGQTRQETLDRGARRRARTRAKLIAAARELFARQGIESTRINEITEEADVGFGSFYNHFDSKDAIVDVVIEQCLAEQGAAIDAVTRDLDDPAEVIAVAHRHLLGQSDADKTLGWLLVRLNASHDLARVALGDYARRDLKRGIKAGRFTVEDIDVTLEQTGGALFAVMESILEGRIRSRAASVAHVAGILRLLGLDGVEAAEMAARPQPVVATPGQEPQ